MTDQYVFGVASALFAWAAIFLVCWMWEFFVGIPHAEEKQQLRDQASFQMKRADEAEESVNRLRLLQEAADVAAAAGAQASIAVLREVGHGAYKAQGATFKTFVSASLVGGLWEIDQSENVSSILDNGLGDVTINFERPFTSEMVTVRGAGTTPVFEVVEASSVKARLRFVEEPAKFVVQFDQIEAD